MGHDEILLDQVVLDLTGQVRQRQDSGPRRRREGVARQPGKQPLRQGFEEALDLAPTAGSAHPGKDQADLQVCSHLLDMLRREVAAVIDVEHLGDSADMPASLRLPPDRLTQCQCCLNGRRWLEGKEVAGDGPAVVVEHDRQPGAAGIACTIPDEDIQLAMIGLPDRIGCVGLGPINQVERRAVGLRPLVRQRHEGGFQLADHRKDYLVARWPLPQLLCCLHRLAVDRRRRQPRLPQRQPFDHLLEVVGELSLALIRPFLASQSGQPVRAIGIDPAACGAEVDAMLIGHTSQWHTILQKRSEELKSCQRPCPRCLGQST
jgi:hypothetical protein